VAAHNRDWHGVQEARTHDFEGREIRVRPNGDYARAETNAPLDQVEGRAGMFARKRAREIELREIAGIVIRGGVPHPAEERCCSGRYGDLLPAREV